MRLSPPSSGYRWLTLQLIVEAPAAWEADDVPSLCRGSCPCTVEADAVEQMEDGRGWWS
jgi:hypothetical protein